MRATRTAQLACCPPNEALQDCSASSGAGQATKSKHGWPDLLLTQGHATALLVEAVAIQSAAGLNLQVAWRGCGVTTRQAEGKRKRYGGNTARGISGRQEVRGKGCTRLHTRCAIQKH